MRRREWAFVSNANALADENLGFSVVVRLREAGHQVLAVAEMEPGIPDDVVLNLANAEAAILMCQTASL